MTRIETIGDCTLHLGDCVEILPTLAKIDAVVTSPPYAQQRDYITFIGDKYQSLLGVLADTPSFDHTQILVNLGLIHKDGFVIEYWEPFKRDMAAAMWRLFGWYVWDKQDGMAGDWNGRLAPAHEWIFHFNRQSRRPNKVVQTKGAGLLGYKGNTGLRKPDGSMGGWAHMGIPTQEVKIADSVIRLQPQRDRSDPNIAQHPAVFPVGLPMLLTDSYTDAGEIVCDPFMGSGTTGVACMNLDRKFVGIEIEAKYFDIACKRIEEAYKQPRLFSEPAPKLKQQELSLTQDGK